MTKEQARKASVELAERMEGGGWTPEHWSNIQWHFCVRKGPLRVSEDYEGKYSCLMGDGGSGEGIWHHGTHQGFKDPNAAVKAVISHAEEVVAAEFDRLNKIIFEAKVAIGLAAAKK